MQILEALAAACDQVKAKLEAQLTALNAQTPIALRSSKLSTDTAAGAFIHSLSAKSNLAQLNLLATLSVNERERLATLESDLAQDPKRAAARIMDQKVRLDEFVTALKRLGDATSNSAFAVLDKLKEDRDTKAAAARLASSHLFADRGPRRWNAVAERKGNADAREPLPARLRASQLDRRRDHPARPARLLCRVVEADRRRQQLGGRQLDRKSTRLN